MTVYSNLLISSSVLLRMSQRTYALSKISLHLNTAVGEACERPRLQKFPTLTSNYPPQIHTVSQANNKFSLDYQQIPGNEDFEYSLDTNHIINSRGKKLAYYIKAPLHLANPKALVLFVHAYSDHFLHYEELAIAILKEGYVVFGPDLEGHGHSEGERGLVLPTHFTVSDINQVVQLMREKHPSHPIFAVAHSMGGSMVLATAIKHPDMFNGAVITAPFLQYKNNTMPPYLQILILSASLFHPNMQMYTIELTWKHWAKDEAFRKQIMNDPLLYKGGMKIGTIAAAIGLEKYFSRNMHKLTMPLLIMHGEKDRLNLVEASKYLFDTITSPDKEMKVIKGGSHHLFHDVAKIRHGVIENVVSWIQHRFDNLQS